nr:REn [Boerhavia golden mosaic virus]AVP27518.1 REn [Boerhavia golden mosaic virus]
MDSRTGDPITAHQARNGVFIWEISNPLYFRIIKEDHWGYQLTNQRFLIEIRANHNLRRRLGLHKAFFRYRIWTTLTTTSGTHFVNSVFRNRVLYYLDNLGVISINNIVRAVAHALDRHYVIQIEEDYAIKFNIY